MRSSVTDPGRGASALWLLAGLDPTGGAGLLRDAWTARACAPTLPLGCVVTAWTRQGRGEPASARAREAAAIAEELAALPRPAAIKLGLLPAPLVDPVLRAVAARGAPVVLDPVLAASDGGSLGARADALADVLRDLADPTWLVTPNRGEAAALAGTSPDDPDLLARVAERLGRCAVLLKDGHGRDPALVRDALWIAGRVESFARPRLPGPDPRGTGCALATAIACGLAQGRPLRPAIAAALAWLDAARQRWTPGRDGKPHLPFTGPPLAET